MTDAVKTINKLMKQLPPDKQQEVEEYVRSLVRRRDQTRKRPFRLDWRGALRDERDKYTSVELQHEILESWGG